MEENRTRLMRETLWEIMALLRKLAERYCQRLAYAEALEEESFAEELRQMLETVEKWSSLCQETGNYIDALEDGSIAAGSHGKYSVSISILEEARYRLQTMMKMLREAERDTCMAMENLRLCEKDDFREYHELHSLSEEFCALCEESMKEWRRFAVNFEDMSLTEFDSDFSFPPSSKRYSHSLESWDIARKLEYWMKLAPPPLQCANIAAEIDEVQFRCAAPMVLKPGRYFTAKIMMFREDDTDRADKEAALMDDKVRVASSDVIDAEKGQEFTLRLQSPDLPELDEMKTIRWNGKYAARDFQILLPPHYDREQLRLLGRVYSGMTPLTDISLILEICNPVPQKVVCEKLRLRTAFVSYASKDRAEVVKRIQGMEAAHMDVFIDVEGLRRGEEYEPRLYQEIRDRDLFFLFWSRNAAKSKWVEKELTYAMEHKPMTQIEPIALEAPDVCPPPESLSNRHFRDWTLNYTT